MQSLFQKSATELANLIHSKDLSPVDLIEATLRRILFKSKISLHLAPKVLRRMPFLNR